MRRSGIMSGSGANRIYGLARRNRTIPVLASILVVGICGLTPLTTTVSHAVDADEGLPGDWLARYASARTAGATTRSYSQASSAA